MESQSPFATMTLSADVVADRVLKELGRDCVDGRFDPCLPGDALRSTVDVVTADLWQARIKTFVPLLALREARATLIEGRRLND